MRIWYVSVKKDGDRYIVVIHGYTPPAPRPQEERAEPPLGSFCG